ncbi:MAG: hypothetical protein JRN54_03450 [Nitrososphaerota archaeon]|nr:hypothetical protein [Nitrososphaerota archaeon]
MSWRTKGRGSSARRFQSRPKRSLYGPAKDENLAADVHASSGADARRSADQLEMDFRSAKTEARREEVWRATLQESNRLFVAGHNRNNGSAARKRLLEEHETFKAKADGMHEELVKEGAFKGGERSS